MAELEAKTTASLGALHYHSYQQAGMNLMPTMAPLALIALPGSRTFTEKVDQHLYARRLEELESSTRSIEDTCGFLRPSYLVKSDSVRFSSGEGKGTIADSIRGHDVYIFCDVLNHSIEYKMFGKTVPMGPDEHFQDMVRMILATCGKAARLNVVIPFLYQSRQNVRQSRESLDCAYMLKELESLGVSNIISFDPHDARVENALPKKAIDNFPSTYQLIKTLCQTYPDLDFQSDSRMMVISPDEMGLKRAMYYANVLGLPLGTFYRKRSFDPQAMTQQVHYEFLGDSPEGRDVLIIDDMIVTGGTMIETAKKLKKQNARRIFCLSSYAPMVKGIGDLQSAVDEGLIDRVFSTNLIYNWPELEAANWYVQADMSKTVALVLDALNHNASIASILNQTEKIKQLLQQYTETQTLH